MSKDKDPQTQKLRRQLTKLCPEMEKQLQQMNKEDLMQLLQSIEQKPEELNVSNPSNEELKSIASSSKKESKKMSKEQMIEELKKVFPENDSELQALEHEDVEELYINYKQKQLQKKMKQQKKCEPKPQVKKKKILQNGQINVFQMKRFLIDKLPQYRNDIRNLPEDEIKKMFRDIQSKQANQKQLKGMNSMNMIPQNGPMMGSMLRDSNMQQMSNTGPSMMSISRGVPQRQNIRYDQDQIYDNNDIGGEGKKQRGRPKKFKDETGGFTYDDVPPNFINMSNVKPMSSKPYQFGTDFAASQYSTSNMNSQYPSQIQPGFAVNSIYDTNINYKTNKMLGQAYQDYSLQNPQQLMAGSKSIQKHQTHFQKQKQKQKQKIKVTFYINQSDLQQLDQKQKQEEIKRIRQSYQQNKDNNGGSGNSNNNEVKDNRESQIKRKIDRINRSNRLADVIEKLRCVFTQKNWKVQ